MDSDSSPYSHSTQKRFWLFTREELSSTRHDVHRKASSVLLSVKRNKPTPHTSQKDGDGANELKSVLRPNRMSLGPDPTPQHTQNGLEDMKTGKRMSLGTDTKPPGRYLEPPSTPDATAKSLNFEVSPMSAAEPAADPDSGGSPFPQQSFLSPSRTFPTLVGIEESPLRLPGFALSADAAPFRPPPPPSREKKPKKGPPLTQEEEGVLRLHYEKLLMSYAMCEEMKLPPTVPVWATALTFFKRFFLFSSMMDYNPVFVMVTCLNLAIKAEEQRHVTLQAIADITKLKVDQLVQWEVPVLEGIRFHLLVFHPFRPLAGLLDSLEKWLPPQLKQEKKNAMICLHEEAHELLKSSYFTDVSLLFTPSQIALAALRKVALLRKFEFVDTFLKEILAGQPMQKTEMLFSAVSQIESFFEEGLRLQAMDLTEAATLIDLKLKQCGRTDKFRVRNEQQELERKAKRERKALERKREQEQQLLVLGGPSDPTEDEGSFLKSAKKPRAPPAWSR